MNGDMILLAVVVVIIALMNWPRPPWRWMS